MGRGGETTQRKYVRRNAERESKNGKERTREAETGMF